MANESAADGSTSFRKSFQRQEDKWWLPVPRVSPGGLQESSRKQLQHKRDCTNQILKAAMAINSITLADMEIPESYLESLPRVKKQTILYTYSANISDMKFKVNIYFLCNVRKEDPVSVI